MNYTSCQVAASIKNLAKLAASLLTTICKTSIVGEGEQFRLIACKGRQKNWKNDCPHTKIHPLSPPPSRGHTPLVLQSNSFKCFPENFQPIKRTLLHLRVPRWLQNGWSANLGWILKGSCHPLSVFSLFINKMLHENIAWQRIELESTVSTKRGVALFGMHLNVLPL